MRELLRWLWTQVTSMRTALVLLFLLALTAIPGSFIPQQSTSPIRVSDFAASHKLLDKIYRPLGFYHVYTSPWFSAVYLLLFVSLIGCIIPRVGVYLRAVRTPPPRMPARLDRLPESARVSASEGTDAEQTIAAAQAWLTKNRFRTVRRDDAASGALGISAERGYLREFGNLLFHISAVFVLVGVAVTNLYGYKGTAQVVVGQGFSNTITQYDQFSSGAMVNTDDLNPFTVLLKTFNVTFETGPVQTGAARSFDATVDVSADGRTTSDDLQVNHPLTIDGTKVHLLGHGYAAHVTIRDGNGNVALSGPVVCQPLDGNFRSTCVINAPDARPQRVAFQGFFLPTAVVDAEQGPHSVFPDALSPALFVTGWYGAPQVETGLPHSVFSLDTTGMTQMKSGSDLLRIELRPGDSYKLPNQLGTITFDGWSRWANLQISRTPGLWLTVASIGLAVCGLCLSLFIRPRRLWIRVLPGDGGTMQSLVEAGGLDRADARTGLADDVLGLVTAATGSASDIAVRSRGWTPTPDPDRRTNPVSDRAAAPHDDTSSPAPSSPAPSSPAPSEEEPQA